VPYQLARQIVWRCQWHLNNQQNWRMKNPQLR
jgi:hypothetical protein